MAKHNIFLVDDNLELQETVRENLESDGYSVITASSAGELFEKLKTNTADTILLDLILPDGNGLALIEKIRDYTDAPVIVVSGKGEMVDRVVGLEMGADDYLAKPFEMRELSARIKANIRRYKAQDIKEQSNIRKQPEQDENLEFGCWVLDRSKFQLYDRNGNSADLTIKEFRLLETLLMSPNRVLTREQILEKVRADNMDIYDRAIDVQIARIRKKIEANPENPHFIKTVRGAGYMLVVEQERPL